MTGSTQVLIASGGLSLTPITAAIKNTSPTSGLRTGTLSVVSDGTYTATGSASGNWFSPTTVGVGATVSIRFTTLTSSLTTITGATLSTWLSLSGTQAVTFGNTLAVNEGTGTMTVDLSLNGGASIAATSTISWDVGFAP